MPWSVALRALALPAVAQSPAFEVISIKPNNTADFRSIRMKVLPGGRFSATALPLRMLLVYAYDLPMNTSERLSGVPDWANREQFDIEAKPPDGAFTEAMPTSEARAKMQAMMQALLADRFKLVMRRETKDLPMYALTVGKGGPKLAKATIEEKDCSLGPTEGVSCHQFNGGQGRGLHAKAVSMTDLAGFIENWTDHPVVDRTGLGGLFAMDTEGWLPDARSAAAARGRVQPQPGAALGRWRYDRCSASDLVHGAPSAGARVETAEGAGADIHRRAVERPAAIKTCCRSRHSHGGRGDFGFWIEQLSSFYDRRRGCDCTPALSMWNCPRRIHFPYRSHAWKRANMEDACRSASFPAASSTALRFCSHGPKRTGHGTSPTEHHRDRHRHPPARRLCIEGWRPRGDRVP